MSFPGASIRDIVSKVEGLCIHRNSTLTLSCGGNDLFLRNRRCGNANQILDGFTELIKVSKKVANRVVIVGLIPRRWYDDTHYGWATFINDRLAKICNSFSVRFVDVWKRYFAKNSMYAKDGTHFSRAGSAAFAELVNSRQFGPLKVNQPKNATAIELRAGRAGTSGEGIGRRKVKYNAARGTLTTVISNSNFKPVGTQTKSVETQTDDARVDLTPSVRAGKRGRSRSSSRGESISPMLIGPAKRQRAHSMAETEDDVEALTPRPSSPSAPRQQSPAPAGRPPAPPSPGGGSDPEDGGFISDDTLGDENPEDLGNMGASEGASH